MERIALNDRIFRIMNAMPIDPDQTPRGCIMKGQKGEQNEYTVVTYAYDETNVGVVTFPTPLKDVIEYFDGVEKGGEIPGFDIPITIREATEEELPILADIVADVRASNVQKRRDRFRLVR